LSEDLGAASENRREQRRPSSAEVSLSKEEMETENVRASVADVAKDVQFAGTSDALSVPLLQVVNNGVSVACPGTAKGRHVSDPSLRDMCPTSAGKEVPMFRWQVGEGNENEKVKMDNNVLNIQEGDLSFLENFSDSPDSAGWTRAAVFQPYDSIVVSNVTQPHSSAKSSNQYHGPASDQFNVLPLRSALVLLFGPASFL
ncbi:hypothetical protein U1Q18_007558, partial [Sarracenia purpurea var. burkii]